MKPFLMFIAGAFPVLFIGWCFGLDFTERGNSLGVVVIVAFILGVFNMCAAGSAGFYDKE